MIKIVLSDMRFKSKYFYDFVRRNLFIFIIFLVVSLLYHDLTFRRVIEIELKSETPEYIQVFYDIGRGYKQFDSKTNSIVPSNNFKISKFIYPNKKLISLRFDPAMRNTRTEIRSIRVNGTSYSADELFLKVSRSQQVDYLVSDEVFKITSLGNDPYLSFDVNDKTVKSYSHSFFLSVTAVLLITSVILIVLLKICAISFQLTKNNKLKKLSKILPVLFLCSFFSFTSYNAYKVKLWDYPDEIGHYSYVKDLSQFELPKIGEAKMDKQALEHWGLSNQDRSNWIAQHPPVYYVLLAPILYIFQDYSLNIQVAILRSVTSLIAFVNLLVIYKVLLEISKSTFFSSLGVLLIALLPNYLFLSSSINNDLLVSLFTSASLLFLIKTIKRYSVLSSFLSVLFISLAGLTKMTALTLVPVHFLMILFLLGRYFKKLPDNTLFSFTRKIFVICFPYLFLLMWHIRLYLLYGTPVATNSITQNYSLSTTVTFNEFLSQQTIPMGLFGTFISSLGWAGYGHNIMVTLGIGRGNYLLVFGAISLFVVLLALKYYLQKVSLKISTIPMLFIWVSIWLLLQKNLASTDYSLIFSLLFPLVITAPILAFNPYFLKRELYYPFFALLFFSFLIIYVVKLKAAYEIFGVVRAVHGRYLYPLIGVFLILFLYPAHKAMPKFVRDYVLLFILILYSITCLNYIIYEAIPFLLEK